MSNTTENVLVRRWAEYQKYQEAGAAFSALVTLAEIENVLRHEDSAHSRVQAWRTRIGEVRVSDEELASAKAEAKEQMSRMARMLRVGLSLGEPFVFEEMVVALTQAV